tara:strand:+ start:71 stop:256 length:186 start_codon:yes stop_codon:yes gene_type:complete
MTALPPLLMLFAGHSNVEALHGKYPKHKENTHFHNTPNLPVELAVQTLETSFKKKYLDKNA